MTVSPLLAATPMAISAARSVVGQLPGQAAAFARVLAAAVGVPQAGSDHPGAESVPPLGSRTSVDSGLVERLQNVAVDQPTKVLRLLRRRLAEVIQGVGHGDATEGVRVRVTADRGIRVAGDPPGAASLQRALAADPEVAQLIDRLPPAWLEAGLGMTLRAR